MPAMWECYVLCQLDQKQTPPLKHLIIIKIHFNYLGRATKGFGETKTVQREVPVLRSTQCSWKPTRCMNTFNTYTYRCINRAGKISIFPTLGFSLYQFPELCLQGTLTLWGQHYEQSRGGPAGEGFARLCTRGTLLWQSSEAAAVLSTEPHS